MKLRPIALSILTVAGGLSLAGCGMTQVHRAAEAEYQSANTEAAPYLSQIAHQYTGSQSTTDVSNLPYVSVKPVAHASAYPPIFSESVAINSAPGESIGSLLRTVSRLSGVRIVAGTDVLTGAPMSATPAVATSGGNDSTLDLPPSIIGGSATASTTSPDIHYNGDLKSLLDQIAAGVDAKWTYDNLSNTVRFFRYETKVFTLATTPGSAKSSTSVGGVQQTVQGSGGQSTRVSGADTTTEFTGDLAVWKSVGDAVKSMLSPTGKVTLSEATGTIVVRDRYDRVDEISNYVQQINAKLQMAVSVNVTVYRLHVNDQDQHGIDWNVMYNTLGRLANRAGATIATTQVPISGATSLVLNAPDTNKQGLPSLFAGTKFFLQALSTFGHASVLTNATAITTNNQPNTIKVVDDQAYLASATSLYTAGGGGNSAVGAGATLTPGSVETGFTMQVLPSVLADGHHLLLQLAISDSTLNSLDQVESGGNMIQTPNVTSRQTIQRAWLKSGQTLVLAGFQNTNSNQTTNTPFGRHSWLFGGNRNVSHGRDAVVIVITPVVTNAASDDFQSSAAL